MFLKGIKTKIIGPGAAEAVSEVGPLCLMAEAKTLERQVTEAFELLRMPLYQYLMAVFGNPAEAEDLTQETFARLYASLRKGNTIRNVRFWAFRVAHNLAVNHRRQIQFFTPVDADTWDELIAHLPDMGLNPEQDIIRRERFAKLFDGLKRLTLDQRQALYLRTRGFKYKEIGEIMGCGSSTISQMLRRGIRKLSEHQGD